MSSGLLRVNRNLVEPLFDVAALRSKLPVELQRHNDVVQGLYDSGYYNKFKHGGPFYLEPEVTYSLGGQQNLIFPDPYSAAQVRRHNFHVTGFGRVPWADWDWPSDAHSGDSVTVGNLNDIYGLIEDFTGRNNARARVYLTPKGAHATILSHNNTPQEFTDLNLFGQLNPDANYVKLSTQPKTAPQEYLDQGFTPKPVFNVRVSPKDRPGDPVGDFVAFNIGEIGDGLVIPENERLVKIYHDEAIKRALENAPYDPTVEAAKVLGNQMAGLPSSFRDPIEQKLDAYLTKFG